MDRLTFVGVQDDGEHLVLESPDGEHRYRVVIDNSLRNAVVKAKRAQTPRGLSGRGDYGPRDIQTRFRQGASVDEIVAESGWKPERVRRYEWPILAERAHIVTAARNVVVRPLDPASRGRKSLNDQVVGVREDWNFAEGDAQWNAWQREDGQWNVTVSVDYSQTALSQIPSGADFPARFVYNPANQTVVAGNAVAEFLMGRPHGAAEDEAIEELDEPAVETEPDQGRDQETIGSPAAEDTLESADAAPRSLTEGDDDASDAGSADEDSSSDEHDEAQGPRNHLRAVGADEPSPTETLLDELESRRGTPAGSDPASDRRVSGLTQELPGQGTLTDEGAGSEQSGGSDGQGADGPGAEGQRSGKSRSGRPSVPSWDDILFGQQRPKD
ncbi:MAG: DUF3071 domain-containing protein [Kocuria sp.]|nr:DUF3071 domain-containing protein [Kocuria sp.]